MSSFFQLMGVLFFLLTGAMIGVTFTREVVSVFHETALAVMVGVTFMTLGMGGIMSRLDDAAKERAGGQNG